MELIQWTLNSTVGSTCNVYIGLGQGMKIIKKEYLHNFSSFNSEVTIMSLLSNKKHFPKLISVDHQRKIIYMSYCGPEMYSGNMPITYVIQLNEILDTLEEMGIHYLDFKSQHLRCHTGILYLIDFGASKIGHKRYSRVYKYNVHHFTH